MEVQARASPAFEEDKPGFFTWRFWSLLFGALKVWKYSPKDWAIWHLSSYVTYATVFGLLKPIAAWLTKTFPWVVPVLKTVWAKVVAVVIAVWEFTIHSLFG